MASAWFIHSQRSLHTFIGHPPVPGPGLEAKGTAGNMADKMPALRGACIPGKKEIDMKELSKNAYLRCRQVMWRNIKEGRGIGGGVR